MKSSQGPEGKLWNSQCLSLCISMSDGMPGTAVATFQHKMTLITKILASLRRVWERTQVQLSLKHANYYASGDVTLLLRHFETQISVTCSSKDPATGNVLLQVMGHPTHLHGKMLTL